MRTTSSWHSPISAARQRKSAISSAARATIDEAYSAAASRDAGRRHPRSRRRPTGARTGGARQGAAATRAEIAGSAAARTVRQARADWHKRPASTPTWQRARAGRQLQLERILTVDQAIRTTQFNDYNRAYVNLNMSTTVYDWGKNSKTIESRSKTATAAEYKYIATAQQNAYDIATNLVEAGQEPRRVRHRRELRHRGG